MPRSFDYERASSVLAEAHFTNNDEAICERWKISRRTLQLWRARVLEDPILAHNFALKKEALRQSWEKEAKSFLRDSLAQLSRMTHELPSSPQSVHALAGAIKIVGELCVVREVLADELEAIDEGTAAPKAKAAEAKHPEA